MKRIISLLLVLVLMLQALPLRAKAAEPDFSVEETSQSPTESSAQPVAEETGVQPRADIVASGWCGDNVTWEIERITGHMTIRGTGPMWDFDFIRNSIPPWYEEYYSDVTIEEGVTSIGAYAFSGQWVDSDRRLTGITIADSVTSIGTNAFHGCDRLTQIELPDSITHIGSAAFCGTSISSIVLPDQLTEIGDSLFADCYDLTGIALPSGLTTIGDYAFSGCNHLQSIELPETVTSIGTGVFKGCSKLEEIILPEGISTIPYRIFYLCTSLTSFTIPESVTFIEEDAFAHCRNLSGIAIPSGVTTLAQDAFYGCTGLKTILFYGDAPTIDYASFQDVTATAFYPKDNPTWDTFFFWNYGGNITWEPFDPGASEIQSVVQTYGKHSDQTLVLTAAEARGSVLDTIASLFEDLTFDVSSILGKETTAMNFYQLMLTEAVMQDVVVSKDGFHDYIIPTQVSASFVSAGQGDTVNAYKHTVYLFPDSGNGEPYISTVFGRASGDNAAYQELRYQELKMYPDATFDVIISAGNLDGQRATYYIGQDGARRVESAYGVFSSVDLYNTFDFGKDVYAYAVAEDGTETKTVKLQLTKMKGNNDDLEAFLKSSSFSLMGKDGQTITIPESFPLVGGGKISLEAFQAPIGIDVQGGKVKISFGVDVFSAKKEYDDPQWETSHIFKDFKKNFKTLSANIQSAEEELDIYRTFQKKYSNDYSGYYEKSKNWNVAFLGYAEGTIVNGTIVFTDMLLNVKGQFTFKYTQQGAIWIVPAYFYVEAGASASLTTQRARLVADKEVPLDFGLILEISPALKLGGGAGVKNAVSAGIWGKGTLPYNNNFSDQYHSLKLIGEFGWEAEFFILKAEDVMLSGETSLFEGYYGSPRTYALRNAGLNSRSTVKNTGAVTLCDRDYAPSEWLGESPSAASFAVADNGVSFRDLQADVFDRSQAQIAALGDSLIMVWVEDDTTRDSYNRMRLVYSLYDTDTDTWTQPQPVSDDGCNDAYPCLVSDGSNAYVVWQKIGKILTEEDCTGPEVLLEESELFLARFDAASGQFVSRKLTDNTLYEYAAIVTLEGGEPVIRYASASGAQLNCSGATTLYRQTQAGDASVISSGLNYILAIDAAGEQVSYVMDTDGDLFTTNDINVYTIQEGETSAFDKSGNEVGYTFAAYAELNGEPTLFTSDMRNIYYVDNGETRHIFPIDRSITGNLNLVRTAAGTTIVWTETDEYWNTLYAVSYEDGVWTEPVQIGQNRTLISDVDTTVFNGKMVGICNTTRMNYNFGSDSYQPGETNLTFFTVNDFTDLAIYSGFYVDETAIIPGQDYEFDVIVANKGTIPVDSVQFTVSDTLYTHALCTREVSLQPGEIASVTITYPVPESYRATTLGVYVNTTQNSDTLTENNYASIEIGKPDLSVTQTAVHIFNNGYILEAAVENGSAVAAEDVTLHVIPNDKENGPVHILQIGTLDRSSYAGVDIALGTDRLIFDENGIAKVYLRTQCATQDAADADNLICILLSAQRSDGCAHLETETVSRQEPTCTENGHTEYIRCVTCGEAVSGYEELPAGHSYTSQVYAPSCYWEGYTQYECTVCGDRYQDDFLPITHDELIIEPAVPPTCTEVGVTEGKRCANCGVWVVSPELEPATGHTEVIDEGYASTCVENGMSEGSHCSTCGLTLTVQDPLPLAPHTEVIDAGFAPTCTETGLTDGMHCDYCGITLVYQSVISETGHTEQVIPGRPATETETGLTDGMECVVCGEILIRQEVIGKLEPGHICQYTQAITEPTCTEPGYTTFTCTCGNSYMDDHTPALGHTKVIDDQVDATCTEPGLTKGSHCSVCQAVLVSQETIPAQGHRWDAWTVMTPATFTSEGEEVRICQRCGQGETRSIPKLVNPFVDVIPGKFYEIPVLWAVENGVTNGMDDTHFAPDATCNRGQVVTFLWRAAGSPEPSSSEHPFTDLNSTAFYYKAVLWAVEKGITNGTTATTFSPGTECTRGQVVTFLHRFAGSPKPTSQEHPFTDCNEEAFYYTSMLWAVENGITTGSSPTTFAPNGECNRGQIVTFLFRLETNK